MKIDRLGGGGSDYVAFVQHVGVPSIDVSYGEGNPRSFKLERKTALLQNSIPI